MQRRCPESQTAPPGPRSSRNATGVRNTPRLTRDGGQRPTVVVQTWRPGGQPHLTKAGDGYRGAGRAVGPWLSGRAGNLARLRPRPAVRQEHRLSASLTETRAVAETGLGTSINDACRPGLGNRRAACGRSVPPASCGCKAQSVRRADALLVN